MSQHFKVHELLKESELEELRAFAREPGRTVDEIHQWMLERGFTLSRNACWTWKSSFEEELLAERFRRSGDLARSIKDAVKSGSFGDVADAAVMQLTQVIFEQAARLDGEGTIDTGDLVNMANALRSAAGGKQRIEQIRRDQAEKEQRATDEAAKVAKSGGSGEAVVAKVREILGMK